MILYKVIHSPAFHLEGSSKGVAGSLGRWEVLLIKHSVAENIAGLWWVQEVFIAA